jgi:hypothetical protein
MRIIVIRQPWAWLIVNGYKPIENRSWATKYRGPLLIQAAARKPATEDLEYVRRKRVKLPENFDLGGIVGSVQLDDCVSANRSKWFEGPIGWVLSKPRRLPFVPLKGRLGLYPAPKTVLKKLGIAE